MLRAKAIKAQKAYPISVLYWIQGIFTDNKEDKTTKKEYKEVNYTETSFKYKNSKY